MIVPQRWVLLIIKIEQVEGVRGRLNREGIYVSVQFSCSVVSDFLLPHEMQHARPPCPSPTPRACSNSCPSGRWCYPTISSSVVPFTSCLQFFPASGSFPMSRLFPSGGQSYWSFSFSNEYSGLISFRIECFDLLQSKQFSRVFSNSTVQKHQFFSTQLFLWSDSRIHTWLLKKP